MQIPSLTKRDEESPQPAAMLASDEIINLLSQAPNVLEFTPSESACERVWELVAREKQGVLSSDEKFELDHYGQIEHLVRLVKTRARQRLRMAK